MTTRDLNKADRLLVKDRDRNRCLRCGRRPATIQHRRAKGMGGVGPTGPALTPADAVLLCLPHNREAEGSMQQIALRLGWKVPRSCPVPCDQIPYFDAMTGSWWLPDTAGGRSWVPRESAEAMIRAALANQ